MWLIGGLIWSLFMGITFVSMGLGALFPTLNKVAKPFVCPGGQMEINSQNYQVSPVEHVTTFTWYCVDEQSGTKTELNFFSINAYAGSFYGLLMFATGLTIWYLYNRRIVWIQNVLKIIFAVGIILIILFPAMPLFNLVIPQSKPLPDATATALALTYQALTSGTPRDFSSTDQPLTSWNDIPIMPQAIAGQQTNNNIYTFKVPVDSGTIETFYSDTLKSLGWKLEDSRWLGMKFTKEEITLLVTLAPATDTESWIVTLVFVP